MESVVRYELRSIPYILIRASKDTPFEARAEVVVTIVTRKSEKTITVPPIPPGYRASADGDVSTSAVAAFADRMASASPWTRTLSPVPAALPNDLPGEVRDAAPALADMCLRSEPSRSASSYLITFIYVVSQGAWKPAGTPQEQ